MNHPRGVNAAPAAARAAAAFIVLATGVLQAVALAAPQSSRGEMFSEAEKYERFMGRWSRRLAPHFVKFAGMKDGERVLDVGSGTGSLALAIAAETRRCELVGIDLSPAYVDFATKRNSDP